MSVYCYSLLFLLLWIYQLLHSSVSTKNHDRTVDTDINAEKGDIDFHIDEDYYISKFTKPVQNYLYKIKVINIYFTIFYFIK
jgi:hypothetical protein